MRSNSLSSCIAAMPMPLVHALSLLMSSQLGEREEVLKPPSSSLKGLLARAEERRGLGERLPEIGVGANESN